MDQQIWVVKAKRALNNIDIIRIGGGAFEMKPKPPATSFLIGEI